MKVRWPRGEKGSVPHHQGPRYIWSFAPAKMLDSYTRRWSVLGNNPLDGSRGNPCRAGHIQTPNNLHRPQWTRPCCIKVAPYMYTSASIALEVPEPLVISYPNIFANYLCTRAKSWDFRRVPTLSVHDFIKLI